MIATPLLTRARSAGVPPASLPGVPPGGGTGGETPPPLAAADGCATAEPPADIIVIDCSFISLRKILPAAGPLLKAGGKIIALIKPQFEAGKAEADKGRGVITDAAIHERVIRELRDFVLAQAGPVRSGGGSQEASRGALSHGAGPVRSGGGSQEASRGALSHGAGLRWRNVVESPLLGPAGNKEFLVLVEKACAD